MTILSRRSTSSTKCINYYGWICADYYLLLSNLAGRVCQSKILCLTWRPYNSLTKCLSLAIISRIIFCITGKPHLKHIQSEKFSSIFPCSDYIENLTCMKTTSHVDQICVMRKPSCYILHHKSFKAYFKSNSLQRSCHRNHLRHRQEHWKKSSIRSFDNDTLTK